MVFKALLHNEPIVFYNFVAYRGTHQMLKNVNIFMHRLTPFPIFENTRFTGLSRKSEYACFVAGWDMKQMKQMVWKILTIVLTISFDNLCQLWWTSVVWRTHCWVARSRMIDSFWTFGPDRHLLFSVLWPASLHYSGIFVGCLICWTSILNILPITVAAQSTFKIMPPCKEVNPGKTVTLQWQPT